MNFLWRWIMENNFILLRNKFAGNVKDAQFTTDFWVEHTENIFAGKENIIFSSEKKNLNRRSYSEVNFNFIKMKCFASFKRNIQWIGIFREEQNRNKKILLKFLNFAFIANFISVVVTATWFFLVEARTLLELARSFLFAITCVMIISWYSTYLWHQRTYADLFHDLEVLITKSKWISPFSVKHNSNDVFSMIIWFSWKNRIN